MNNARLAKGFVALLIAATGTFAACSDDVPVTPESKHCQLQCNCEGCTESEQGTCIDDITNLKSDASDKQCSQEFDDYLTCMNVSATCSDTIYDTSFCFAEETVLNDCLKPKPPACTTVNDGVCDEPEGTNTCAEGSDVMDCSPACPYVEDGVCNEPAPLGDGLCAPETDTVDCGGTTCLTCAEALNALPASNVCAASESLYSAFMTCACELCADPCALSQDLCTGSTPSAACLSCAQTNCSTQIAACSNDF